MNLRINADDFGIDHGRDFGITLLCLIGCIDSVSAFAVPRYSGCAIYRAILRCFRPKLRVGLHVDLTDGPFQTERMQNMIGQKKFHDKRDFWLQAVMGDVHRDCVYHEIKAQISCFCTVFGYPPGHLDGHNHVHISNEEVYLAFRDIQKEYNLSPLRIPSEDLSAAQVEKLSARDGELAPLHLLRLLRSGPPWPSSEDVAPLADVVRLMRNSAICDVYLYARCVDIIRRSGNKTCKQEFFGTFFGFEPSFREAARIIRGSNRDIYREFMVHPGFNLGFNRSCKFSSYHRMREAFILILVKAVSKLGLLR